MLSNQNIMAFVATSNAAKARPFYEVAWFKDLDGNMLSLTQFVS